MATITIEIDTQDAEDVAAIVRFIENGLELVSHQSIVTSVLEDAAPAADHSDWYTKDIPGLTDSALLGRIGWYYGRELTEFESHRLAALNAERVKRGL